MALFGANDHHPLAGARPAVALGVFDGVHLGHRAIINVLLAAARKISAPALAITFQPHPRAALGRAAPPGICSLDTRLRRLEEAGLDAIWLLPFTQELSRMSGRDFAGEFFHRRLAARAVVMGETASFGCGRDGNARSLSLWARDWDMRILTAPALPIHGAIVSSTAIRLAVRTGDLRRAAEFLGRPFSLEGTVVRGQGRGRKLGFPTLNLDPHHELRPPPGVYLTRTRVAGQALPSLTNIGRPPTETEIESGLSDFVIETHLLDFDANLYGQAVEVIFSEKIRDVMRFDRESELARQVVGDINQARRWFASHPED